MFVCVECCAVSYCINKDNGQDCFGDVVADVHVLCCRSSAVQSEFPNVALAQ